MVQVRQLLCGMTDTLLYVCDPGRELFCGAADKASQWHN